MQLCKPTWIYWFWNACLYPSPFEWICFWWHHWWSVVQHQHLSRHRLGVLLPEQPVSWAQSTDLDNLKSCANVGPVPSSICFPPVNTLDISSCSSYMNTSYFYAQQEKTVIEKLHVHGSVHHNINLTEITTKMRPCSGIYYSSVS